jgi:ABC-2 type transport system permease protein
MNWEHLKTYIWIRWRISANQVKRSGTVGAIIASILAVLRIAGGMVAFITGLLVGLLALRGVDPKVVMFVWDGVAAGFILFWLVGLMSELQRTDLLSLNNFMHLPVSPSGAFLINYVGSSASLSLVLFFPAMIGLSFGLTSSQGPAMLWLFPLAASFVLMVTAVTYQFRGWLAGMMTNPRRRRAIIAVVSLLFILVFQIPNILTNFNPAFREKRQAERKTAKEIAALGRELDEGRITQQQYNDRLASKRAALESNRKRESELNEENLRLVNMVLPPGWLPYGAEAAAQGKILPAAACMFGMGLIGIASLRRSYRTTTRLYTGDFGKGRTGRKIKVKTVSEVPSKTISELGYAAEFLEKKLPLMSEHASIIALAGFRSLMRAIEVKMMLLTPVIMLIVFGGILMGNRGEISGLFRPLSALGFSAFVLIISMTGFMGNQFAFDRSGFRSFVLSGVPRREILLGKNLSMLPVAVALMALIAGFTQWLNPMRPDHLAAVLIQILPMYLLLCLFGNVLSILSPMTLKYGSGMPAPHQGTGTIFQIVFMLVVPIPLACTLIPLGIESLFSFMGWAAGFPIFLILGAVQAVVVVWLYRRALGWQGRLLQRQEQKILEVVVMKGE